MKTLGRHVISEHFGCASELLDDVAVIEAAMLAAAQAIGATLVSSAFHRYEPQGVSGVLLIAESHLSIHTWPEHRYAAVDIFTCGGLDPRPGLGALASAIRAQTSRMQEIVRGLPEHVLEGEALLPADVTVLLRHSPK